MYLFQAQNDLSANFRYIRLGVFEIACLVVSVVNWTSGIMTNRLVSFSRKSFKNLATSKKLGLVFSSLRRESETFEWPRNQKVAGTAHLAVHASNTLTIITMLMKEFNATDTKDEFEVWKETVRP